MPGTPGRTRSATSAAIDTTTAPPYPNPMLNAVDAAFAETLSAQGIAVTAADAPYLEEPRGLYAGTSEFVALPR